MKKLLLALVLICIAAVGAWYFTRPEPTTISTEKFLPKETLLSIEIMDMEKGIKEFKNSRLGRKLAGIDIANVMERLGTDEEKIARYRDAEKKVLDLLESAVFAELFGREVRFALLPLDDKLDDPRNIFNNFILITKPKHKAEVVELVGNLAAGEFKTDSQTYGNHEIRSLDIGEDVSLHYTLSDGLMLAALDPDTIRKSIDLRKGTGNTLSENSSYEALRQKISKPDSRTFIFADLDAIFGSLFDHLPENLPEEEEKEKLAILKEQIALVKGFKILGYTSYKESSNMMIEKVLISFDKAEINPRYSSFLEKEPGKNRTLAMAPKETLFYNWANTVDLKATFNELMSKEGMKESINVKMKERVATMTGVSFDTLVGAVGSEFAFILSDLNATGVFPVVKLAIMLEVNEQEVIEQALAKLTTGSGMVFQKQDFDGIEIKSITLPFGEEIQPSYAFYEGFWIVSINPQMIKEMTSARKEGSGIGSDQSFISVDKGLSGQNNSVTFVKVEKLIESLEKLVAWGSNMAAMKGPEVAEKVNIVVTDVVYPLLDGLKMYKAIGSRTFVNGNLLEVNTFSKIEE